MVSQAFTVVRSAQRRRASTTRKSARTFKMNPEVQTLDLRGCQLVAAVEVAGCAMTVELRGEIDLANADLVLDALTGALNRTRAGSFTLDIAGLSFLDIRGVRTFVALTRVAEATGVEYRIVGAQRQVRRVFELSSLAARLDVEELGRVEPVARQHRTDNNDVAP
jgi:anti-anti-sigma factor